MKHYNQRSLDTGRTSSAKTNTSNPARFEQNGRTSSARPNVLSVARSPRQGLSESLEDYAARLGLDRGAARLQWRAFGVQLLGLGASMPIAVIMRSLAPYELDSVIMPGLRVPTRNGRGIEDRS